MRHCKSLETYQLQVHKENQTVEDQTAKCKAKEDTRTQLLENMMMQQSSSTDWITEAKLAKAKNKTVTALTKPASLQQPTKGVQTTKTKPLKITQTKRAKVVSKARTKKITPPGNVEIQAITEESLKKSGTLIHFCGCRHGDLSALKSFNKSNATYYTRPNRYLEAGSCLDCKQNVEDMKSIGSRQGAVVFYCDEGIKGFGAPDDDPMKEELTCDLVLCPQCEASRRVKYELGESGITARGRKSRRQH